LTNGFDAYGFFILLTAKQASARDAQMSFNSPSRKADAPRHEGRLDIVVCSAMLFALCLALSPQRAAAAPPEVERSLSNARLVGQAPYQRLGLHLFDAALWAEANRFTWDQPFALTLSYRRSFSAAALANRGVLEMSRRRALPNAEGLRARLQACFADVNAGDRITGVSTGANTATFYFNGSRRCTIEQPGFARAFFGIWLDGAGGNQRFSERLLGSRGTT
jgi:hypothetical protein